MISCWKESIDRYTQALGLSAFFRKNEYYGVDETPYEKPVSSTKFAVFIGLYLLISFITSDHTVSVISKGIASQFLVLISVYMTMRFERLGYRSALILSVINLGLTCYAAFVLGVTSAVIGIIVHAFIIILVNIIRRLVNENNRQFKKVIEQKAEITALYEEISASEEELRQQNDQLTEYNRLIKKNEEKLNHLAHFDPLTELPNRHMIMNELENIIRLSRTSQLTFAVVFIDLDNFKKINDTLGHHIGDRLIQSVSQRLRAAIYTSDLLARLGGDEFALIIRQNINEQAIFNYIEKLQKTVEVPFPIERTAIKITASFGIAMYPQDGNDPGELIKCADTAMYQAKDAGKNSCRFFHSEMLHTILAKIEFEDLLANAIKNNEFRMVFQPQYHTDGKIVRGYEALIRWQSPSLGPVSPAKFIPTAEENGQIVPIGKWVLKSAIETFCQLQKGYKLDAILSVNISAVQIESLSFVPMINEILAEYSFPASQLELEITETALIKSMKHTIDVLHELKAIGVKIALDDFGTGYSSLRYLQMLPIDTLKIDKSFVDAINTQNDSRQIVGSIIALVHKLGIEVIAEGIETPAQMNYLFRQGCDYIQGFLLNRPLEINDFEDLVKATTKQNMYA